MKLDIRPMKPEERLYIYQQSSQIEGQTGSIGRLRGDFGKSGTEFYTTWEDYIKKFRSDDFDDEFDKVINALRFEDVGGGLFGSRNFMRLFCKENPDSAFQGNYCEEYGFRIDKGRHSFLIRCTRWQMITISMCFATSKSIWISTWKKPGMEFALLTQTTKNYFGFKTERKSKSPARTEKARFKHVGILTSAMWKSAIVGAVFTTSASLPKGWR